jgi:tetratricopeptide (TPR) repeat protein
LVELGRPGEAGELMLGWLQDTDLDSLMRAAVLLWEGGRLERSLETVQRVLVRAPDSARAQTLEAHLLSSLGRHDEAVARLQRLLRKNPNDLDLLLAMAWSSSRTGNQEKGREWIDRAWEQVGADPDSREAMRCALTAARLELIAENPIVAREWLDRVADADGAGVEYVRLLAETFRRDEQWQDGIAALVRLQPSLSGRAQIEAEAIEAEFRLRIGDPRAWRRLRPLLDDDGLESVLTGLQVLQAVERWQEVDRETAAAIDRFGDDRNLVFTRAAALERLDEVDASAALFRQLVDSEPNDANAANYLGYMWADREMHLEEALALIAGAVALDPENSAFLDSLGWVHFRLGDLDEAERWLRLAVDFGGDLGDGTIYCHLGEVLLAGGDRDEGRHYLLRGLDLGCEDPDHVRSLLERTEDEQP